MRQVVFGVLFALCVSFFIFINQAFSEEAYRFQVTTEYSTSDGDIGNETDTYWIGGRVYLDSVETEGRLKKEAAFLQRIGNFALFLAKRDFETSTNLKGDGSAISVSSTIMRPQSPFLFQVGYLKSETKYDYPTDAENEADTFGVGGGYFVGDTFLVYGRYQYSEIDVTGNSFRNRKIKHHIYSILTKYVKEIDQKGYNIETSISRDDTEDDITDKTNYIFGVYGDYYFNTDFSLGTTISLGDTGDTGYKGSMVGIHANAFITPKVNLFLSYGIFYSSISAITDILTASLSIRF